MLYHHPSEKRGYAKHGWLNAKHTFSFADYYDPDFMGFRVLRVINEDRIEGGAGFPTHGHSNMEIITYIIDGAVEHRDSLGSHGVIRPGDVQRMSAGTGVRHSEFNHEKNKETHLLQIWIEPEKMGIEPSYEQKSFVEALQEKNFVLVANREGKDGSVHIHQDVNLYVGKFKQNDKKRIELADKRYAWIQVVRGELNVNGKILKAGDGLASSQEKVLELTAPQNNEFLFFDLP
jgi:redox-sensitive bicupin YhaK (pirin superfamily)